MNVWKIDPLTDPRWLDIVCRHPRASIFHTRGWLEALWQTYGYRALAFTTSPPGSQLTCAVLYCQVSSWLTGGRLVSLPFSDHCSPLTENPEELECLGNGLKRELVTARAQYIEIRSPERDPLDLAGFTRVTTFASHILDLRPRLEALFRNFHKDCIQRKLRRAEREGLTYEEGRSDSLLHKFYSLLVLTRQRHGLPPQPIQWFQSLTRCLMDAVTIRVASKGKRPVAGILTLRHRRAMVYKYGCSDLAVHNLGGIQMLMWKAIQDAKGSDLTVFDMGRSDANNLGLITFKDRWGATRSNLTYWRISARPLSGRNFKWGLWVGKQMAPRVPRAVLTSLGQFLYKHIG